MKAPVIEKRFHDPNPIAKLNRQNLGEAGILSVSLSGGPGCGKTALIEAAICRLMPETLVGVIACDESSHLDADRMLLESEQVVQVNTGQQGTPDSTHIRDALQWLDLKRIELLFIENVGTLAITHSIDFGQDITAAMFSVAAGDDKASKHPELVKSADVVVLNKIDLLQAVPFDAKAFRADVHRLNSSAELFEVSALNGDGVDRWCQWLKAKMEQRQQKIPQWQS
jgi:hydrogenase nickel incorporation protein HypB